MAYHKEELYDEKTTAAIAAHYKEILRLLGEDPEREGFLKTPERVAKALQFLTNGSQQDGAAILEYKVVEEVGPDHDKLFKIVAYINNNEVGRGEAPTKKEAEMRAAKMALELFGVPV